MLLCCISLLPFFSSFVVRLLNKFGSGTVPCDDSKEIVENDKVIYSHGFNATELQKLLSKQKLPDYIDERAIERQLIRILDLSSEGLIQRGLGEETLLAPLYERVRRHTNPARTMLDGIKNGIPIESYIRQYAAI